LTELAFNLLWSWDHTIRSLFWRLDQALWESSNHNPVVLLGRVPQETLERAAEDPRYMAVYRKACERFDAYMSHQPDMSRLTAYFSMEYGLLDCLPIYSGGLGVLSGDHLKSASDAGIPMVGVGLLYQLGYLQQVLDADGWQQERTPVNDFYSLPVSPVTGADGKELIVHVMLPTGEVGIKVWRINVGRVPLFLLDTNIPENAFPLHRDITDRLYGGDIHTRIRQEIVLGIGGLRALRAMGLEPAVFHMNEGHSAFLAIERVRELMAGKGLGFHEALDATRENNVFTTHTSVPAGIDVFEAPLMQEYFSDYCQNAGFPIEELLLLGHNGKDSTFSMAILALKASAYRNAVSRLNRQVSQRLWQNLWPRLPVWEVPITSVTNGVHLPTWINADLARLYDRHLPQEWREEHNRDPRVWQAVDDIPNQELWEMRRARKRRLVNFVRQRAAAAAAARNLPASEVRRLSQIFDPEVLTIGFARRFATYKRATLLFRDLNRLKSIVSNSQRPVQLIIAGKAHPKDLPGKTLIQQIVKYSRDPELSSHVLFLEDYGIHVAREMVQCCDVWLNTPRRLEEACGTSGMKAGLNGVLNLSVLDGWYDEAGLEAGGWAIGDREQVAADVDEVDAQALYALLEKEVAPLYYDRQNGVPEQWMARVKQSLRFISEHFNCERMVEEYRTQLYEPARRNYASLAAADFQPVRDRAQWKFKVQQLWPGVKFIEVGPGPERTVTAGAPIAVRAVLDLAGLTPEDVRVEAVVGRVTIEGALEDTQVLTLPVVGQTGAGFEFERKFQLRDTGRLGYAVRVSPDHWNDPLTRPCGSLLKWGWDSAD
jgi:starch phosphorylase